MPTPTSQELAAKHGINAAIELFHRRWTLRILWELREGPVTFRALQTACSEVSSSVLNVRLAELREAQLVQHAAGAGYALTDWGTELLQAMRPMMKWALRWHTHTAAMSATVDKSTTPQ